MGQVGGKAAEFVVVEVVSGVKVAEVKPLQRRELSLSASLIVKVGAVVWIVRPETDDREVLQVGQIPEYPEVYVAGDHEICEGFERVFVIRHDLTHNVSLDESAILWALTWLLPKLGEMRILTCALGPLVICLLETLDPSLKDRITGFPGTLGITVGDKAKEQMLRTGSVRRHRFKFFVKRHDLRLAVNDLGQETVSRYDIPKLPWDGKHRISGCGGRVARA